MLTDIALEAYLNPLTAEQADNIRSVRKMIFEHSPSAVEEIDQGKWFGGLLTYTTSHGMFLYALGPRKDGGTTFHMMPYYALAELPQRHAAALRRFLTGKSCIKFKRFADLPLDSIRDILSSAEACEARYKEAADKKSRAKKK